jgi:hypothetical protein
MRVGKFIDSICWSHGQYKLSNLPICNYFSPGTSTWSRGSACDAYYLYILSSSVCARGNDHLPYFICLWGLWLFCLQQEDSERVTFNNSAEYPQVGSSMVLKFPASFKVEWLKSNSVLLFQVTAAICYKSHWLDPRRMMECYVLACVFVVVVW